MGSQFTHERHLADLAPESSGFLPLRNFASTLPRDAGVLAPGTVWCVLCSLGLLYPEADWQRIRQQLHAHRDEQLRQESVRVFIRSMETARFHNGKSVSIYSLMRDGRDLVEKLKSGEEAIQPYVQVVRGEEKCELTGLRIIDIWRYFRHTWTNPYKSIPGRTMMVIVRDKSGKFHPVIGIAALSSATVGSTVRDESIGWTFRQVAGRILAGPSPKYARWMLKITDEAVDEIYKDDLLVNQVLDIRSIKNPTPELIQKLIGLAQLRQCDLSLTGGQKVLNRRPT